MLTEQEYDLELQRRESIKHRDVLLAIASILQTDEGIRLFSYLFESLDVAVTPEQGLKGEMLHDRIGFLRAGNSIYKLACEADWKQAALILTKTERSRYDSLIEQYRIKSNVNTSDS